MTPTQRKNLRRLCDAALNLHLLDRKVDFSMAHSLSYQPEPQKHYVDVSYGEPIPKGVPVRCGFLGLATVIGIPRGRSLWRGLAPVDLKTTAWLNHPCWANYGPKAYEAALRGIYLLDHGEFPSAFTDPYAAFDTRYRAAMRQARQTYDIVEVEA